MHESQAFAVKHFLLLGIQNPVEKLGRFCMLLHLHVHFGPMCLHLLKALGGAHFLKRGAIRPCRCLNSGLHRLCEGEPGGFLIGLQFQLRFQIGQMLGM